MNDSCDHVEVGVSSPSCTEKTRDDLTDAVREVGECIWTRRASMVTVRSWMKNRRQGSDPQCLRTENDTDTEEESR